MADQAREPELDTADSRRDIDSATTIQLLFRLMAPVAVIAFVAAVLTDWAYYGTMEIQYSNASAWLLLVGLVAGGITCALVAISFMGGWLHGPALWAALCLFVVGFIIEIINFMVHNRDGWTTVVPTGFTLSVIGALVMLAAAWLARTPLTERRA